MLFVPVNLSYTWVGTLAPPRSKQIVGAKATGRRPPVPVIPLQTINTKQSEFELILAFRQYK